MNYDFHKENILIYVFHTQPLFRLKNMFKIHILK